MSRRIIVIGGGIAGLAAAAELVRQDCSVILLEAKDRLGGRIHTLETDFGPIELGAEFLHGRSATLQRAINAAGLTAHDLSMRNEILEDGKFRRKDVWDLMSKIIQRIDPARPDCSMEQFLTQEKISQENRELVTRFINGFHAAEASRISAHSLRRAEYAALHMESTAQGRLDAGYAALIAFLAEDVRSHGGEILTGAPVQKINWQKGRVEIAFEHSDKKELAQADAAVVTVSLGVLKSGSIQFQPSLNKKQEAIDQLQFGNVVKITLAFQKKCWPNFQFIQAGDESLPTWWSDARGPLLTGWAGGPQADALASQSTGQLESLALATIKRLFPECAEAFQMNFVASHSHNWAKDPHIRGAYSYIPVNGLDLPKLLAAPVNETLFFAGEATVFDAQTGLVSEAYESGLRAAREVCQAAER